MADKDWKDKLSAEQYQICRLKGTEAPFSGAYWDNKETGTYYCVCCGAPLFYSQDKFDSGTGWPSYTRPVSETALKQNIDRSHGMERIEVQCGRCDSHLGHIFDDGPPPTGKRFCMNSIVLEFVPDLHSKKQ